MTGAGGHEALAQRFEQHRPRLRAVAYRMLGSLSESEDAVQEAWLRLASADTADVRNLDGWLTTVVGRVCLNMLRSRRARGEEPFELGIPDPLVSRGPGIDPEHEALLADSVGLALMVVLGTLAPDERLAFVLHDMFAVPFEEIAPMVERSAAAARQLASRARRRVREQAPAPDPDLARQREAVDAYFAAVREGDFTALVTVLHPEVVLRSDGGLSHSRHTVVLHGAEQVTGQALMFTGVAPLVRPVLVNGAAGIAAALNGRPLSIMAFTVVAGRITAIEVLSDPERLRLLDPALFS
jgi:RNA polymerase sigma factor (sigma-70 family)